MISYRSDRLDRSSDPSRASDDAGGLRWLGPGSTGLVVRDSRDASDEGGWFRRRELGAAEAFAEGDADPDASILAPYFLAGGRRITLVPVPRELRFPLGEDAAPGERHGIHAFRDSDDVGCAIVPELDDRDIDAALAFARENPWLLSILACGGFGVSPSSTSRERSKPSARRERGPSGQAESEAPTRSIEKPLENAILIKGPGAASAALFLAGRLERDDVHSLRSEGIARSRTTIESISDDGSAAQELESLIDEIARRGILSELRSWRRDRGLRRSIDRGTRWLVFSPNHELVRRRAEREVRAFLHALSLDGILPPHAESSARVVCARARGDAGRVRLTIDIELERPRESTTRSSEPSPSSAGSLPSKESKESRASPSVERRKKGT